MTVLSRTEITNLGNKRERKLIQLSEDTSVWITQLTGAEYDWYQSEMFTLSKKGRMEKTREAHSAKMIVLGLINEDGSKMFQRHEFNIVAGWNSALQKRLMQEISEFSGITDDYEDNFLAATSKEENSTG